MNESMIKAALVRFQPESLKHLGADWLAEVNIKKLEMANDRLKLELELGYPIADIQPTLSAEIIAELKQLSQCSHIELNLQTKVIAHAVSANLKPIAGVKNIIAIASGKGGVGKSTTTTNLAAALQQQGARVGILDADIYGPNQPHMLGADKQTLAMPSGALLQPQMQHGIQSMSMGYLVDAATPMIWRGPMVSSALQQLVTQTEWQALDYLLIDLPPGTGDIQLTLAQKIPVTAAVIVTTPQDISLLDARKALEMFRKVNVPVLGVIENMSLHVCTACGHAEAIFGEGGGQRMAQACGTSLLAELPLTKAIREAADRGIPFVVAEAQTEAAAIYRNTARLIAAKLARQAPNYTVKFPRIVVE